MRIGEAIQLDRTDLDWTDAVLTNRASKFGKSRMVPLSLSSACRRSASYAGCAICSRYGRHAELLRVHCRTRMTSPCAVLGRSAASSRPSGVGAGRRSAPPSTTCATPSRSTPCSAGITPARTSSAQLPRLSTYLGHRDPRSTYWYLSAAPELLALAAGQLEAAQEARPMTSIAPTLQGFFTERLISQRHVSPRTIASYRDSLKLLLAFAQQLTGKPPRTWTGTTSTPS